MGLVIDTNVFIAAERQQFDLARLVNLSDYGDAFMAAVTLSELVAGVHLARNPNIRILRSAFVENLAAHIPILEFDEPVARTYAELYALFVRPRSRLRGNVHDLQIAATALAHGFAVLTNNRDDFDKVPGLTVEYPGS